MFPTFLFLVGASIVFSMSARAAKGNCKATLTGRIFARAGKIYLLGLVLAFFPYMRWTHLRLYGVLPRIAVCYLIAALIVLATRRVRWLVIIVTTLLVGYWVLLRWVPVPGIGMPGHDVPFMDKNLNLAAWLDRGAMAWTQRWLHTGTLYNHTHDPEGILSTLPAVATTLLGSLAGLAMQAASAGRTSWKDVRARLAVWGVAGIIAGEVWSRWFPINKNLWTSSYVLLAAGIASLVLAACSSLVDDRPQPWPKWLRALTWPWLIFGSNAIAAFTISIVIVKTMLVPACHRVRRRAAHMVVLHVLGCIRARGIECVDIAGVCRMLCCGVLRAGVVPVAEANLFEAVAGECFGVREFAGLVGGAGARG